MRGATCEQDVHDLELWEETMSLGDVSNEVEVPKVGQKSVQKVQKAS